MYILDDTSVSLESILENYTHTSKLSEEEKKRRNIEPDVIYVKNENIVYPKIPEEEKKEMYSNLKEMYGEGTDDYKFWSNLLEEYDLISS